LTLEAASSLVTAVPAQWGIKYNHVLIAERANGAEVISTVINLTGASLEQVFILGLVR